MMFRIAAVVLASTLVLGSTVQGPSASPSGASSAAGPANAGTDAFIILMKDAVTKSLTSTREALAAKHPVWTDHSTWETAWQVDGAHYNVRTTLSFFDAQELVKSHDEGFLTGLQELLDSDYAPREQAIQILPNLGAYNALGEEHAEHSSLLGSFHATNDASRPIAVLTTNNSTLLRMWTTHSVVHAYVAGAFPGQAPPTWIDEGLASYFASWWAPEFMKERHNERRAAGDLLPLTNLLETELIAYGDSRAADARFQDFAALFTYLIWYREDTRTVTDEEGNETSAPFAEYLRARGRGRRMDDSPVHQLFTTDRNRLQADFAAFEFDV